MYENTYQRKMNKTLQAVADFDKKRHESFVADSTSNLDLTILSVSEFVNARICHKTAAQHFVLPSFIYSIT